MNQPNQVKKIQKNKSTVINLEKGKTPPQAIDLEEVILGACFIDKHAIAQVVEVLSDLDDVFYKEAHKYIYRAMLEMFADNIYIDLLTVSTHLKQQGVLELVGGDFYLIGLSQKVSSSAHIELHCRYIMQYYVKRHSIKVASEIIEEAYDETNDVFELLENSQRSLDDTAQWLLRKKPTDLKSGYQKFLVNKENSQSGIASKTLTAKMSYHPGDLVIFAARPGMGKTAFVLNEAKYQAECNIPVGFLSLEMTIDQLIGRLVSNEFEIEANRIKENQLTPSEKEVLEKEAHKIENLPIHIHDEGSLTTMSAKTIIGKWVRQFGVKIVYIDYLQLMEVYGKKNFSSREQEISYISRTLKSIAKEFEIPIIALSQLSRAVETRGGSKRPILSDLRESGAIEQDADVVGFIYRPEYYNIQEWDDEERGPTTDQCEIDIAKIREGLTGYTRIGCKLKYMRFNLLEEKEPWEQISPLPNQNPSQAFEPVNNNLNDNHDEFPF